MKDEVMTNVEIRGQNSGVRIQEKRNRRLTQILMVAKKLKMTQKAWPRINTNGHQWED
jgi:hypothetical protein